MKDVRYKINIAFSMKRNFIKIYDEINNIKPAFTHLNK